MAPLRPGQRHQSQMGAQPVAKKAPDAPPGRPHTRVKSCVKSFVDSCAKSCVDSCVNSAWRNTPQPRGSTKVHLSTQDSRTEFVSNFNHSRNPGARRDRSRYSGKARSRDWPRGTMRPHTQTCAATLLLFRAPGRNERMHVRRRTVYKRAQICCTRARGAPVASGATVSNSKGPRSRPCGPRQTCWSA